MFARLFDKTSSRFETKWTSLQISPALTRQLNLAGKSVTHVISRTAAVPSKR